MKKAFLPILAFIATLVVTYNVWPFGGSEDITTSNSVGITVPVTVANGGSGAATFTAHGVLMGEGTSAYGVSAAGTTGQPFVSGGASADGAYAVLGAVGGGTGLATVTAHGIMLGEGTSAVTPLVCGAGTILLGSATDPTCSAVPVLGVAATTSGTLGLANGAGGGATFTIAGAATTNWTLTSKATAPAQGDLFVFSNATGTQASVADVAVNQVLVSGGVNTVPAYSANPVVASVTAQGPTAQAVAAGNRIVADTCGGVKQVTAAGAVSTDATDPFTISTTTTNGCVMALCNVSGGANTITVKHSAGHFISQGGADVALAQNTCFWVGNDGTLWRQLSGLQTDS